MQPNHALAVRLRLTRPLERAILSGHPWVYRDALSPFEAAPGTVVSIYDKRDRFVALGLAEAGPIGVRVFTTQPKQPFDATLIRQRVEAALSLRQRGVPADTDAYRLIHGEGDRLPGVVCDRYGPWAVVKLDGEAIAAHVDLLREVLEPALRGLSIRGALLRSSRKQGTETQLFFGEAAPQEVVVQERGMHLIANLWQGQKTGLFLDHRESRARVRALASGLRVLNLYGYTGGFSVAAGLGGASHVTTVDVAAPAIELSVRTFAANDLPAESHHPISEDVPAFLERAKQDKQRYGLIVADPPNFAPNQSKLEVALDSYRALHAACLGLLEPGGLYMAASCSSHVRMGDFVDALREGARRSRTVLQLLEQGGAPFDHPRLLAFPEGDYLKVVLARVV